MAVVTTQLPKAGTGPASPSPAVEKMRPDWELIDTLLAGTTAMRKAGEKYLPRWPNESQAKYDRRLAVSTLFPAYRRTVITLAARPFSKPLTINEDVPDEIKSLLEDADLQGRSYHEVGLDLMQLQLAPGFGGILVDHKIAPTRPDGQRLTVAEEKAAGLRPYMVIVYPLQILGWRYSVHNGVYQLTMLRFMETVEEPDGEFATTCVEQVRVLEPGKWTIYRNGQGGWAVHTFGTTSLKYIPFRPIYGERLGFMNGRPPLLDLVHLNVKHWQSQSDQDNLMHVARVPLLTITGVQDTPDKPFSFTIGTSGAIPLPEGATMEYVEHTGSAVEAGKTSLDDLKEEMRQSGAELLVIKPGPTTATEVASDNAVGMCDLQRMTLSLQDAMNEALQFMADWLGLPKGGTVALFMDFGAATLAEASASLLVGMANSGKLSDETLFKELQRRGIISAEVEFDEEQDRIDAQGPALDELDPLTGKPKEKPAKPGAKPPVKKEPA